jgi:uncharacterized membrane protein
LRKIDLTRIILALSLAGAALAGYLTWYDVVTSKGVCPLTGFFGCSAVLTSAYSRIGGVPVALLGFLWFLLAARLSLLAANAARWIKYLLAWSLLGLVSVIAFVYTEILVIGAFCPFCTSAHVLGLGILAATVSLWLHRSD